MVEEARNKLTDAQKTLTAGRVVAQLSLGFWTSLFNVYYEQKAPGDPRFWPRLLVPVMPWMLHHRRTRKNLVRYLNDIRTLRNRVFHLEPVWHLAALPQQHALILDVIG
jgi:hypothetical protein